MQISKRPYPTTGLLFVAAGAIVATAITPPPQGQLPIAHHLAVHMTALESAFVPRHAASAAIVHVLAEAVEQIVSAKASVVRSTADYTPMQPSSSTPPGATLKVLQDSSAHRGDPANQQHDA